MELFYRCLVYSLLTALPLFSSTNADMFDFHIIQGYHNCLEQERLCKDLGYDGLAVINTPEAYINLLKITDSIRSANKDTYIGAHYRPETGQTLWDDGTEPRSDSPFYSHPPSAEPSEPCARMDAWGMLRMGDGLASGAGVCGSHKNQQTESYGETQSGELQTTAISILYVSEVFSYLECAVLCGTEYQCQAAEFDPDLLTCTLIGQYTAPGVESAPANPKLQTYVREGFN